jgi:hypothetical protein
MFSPQRAYSAITRLFLSCRKIISGEEGMLKRVPKSIWLVTVLIAVVLGILVGIALPQNALTTTIPLIVGWLLLPFVRWPITGIDFVDYVTHVPAWLLWLIFFYYPFAMLMASVCAYWTLWSTGRKRQALQVVGLLACVSALVSIPVSLVAPSLNSNGTFFALVLVIPVWLNLLFSAGLGWCIGCLIPKPKRGTTS